VLTGTAPDCKPNYVGSTSAFGWSKSTVKPSREAGDGMVPRLNFYHKKVFKIYVFFDVLWGVKFKRFTISAEISI
jgi:hypothetical protein